MEEYQIVLPALGMSQTEGIIVEWLRQAGQWVEKDDPLFALETDKTVIEVPAAKSGLLTNISGVLNQPIAVGATIAQLLCPESDDEKAQLLQQPPIVEQTTSVVTDSAQPPVAARQDSSPQQSKAATCQTAAKQPSQGGDQPVPAIGVDSGAVMAVETSAAQQPVATAARILASPKSRALAAQLQLRLEQLQEHPQLQQPYHSRDIQIYLDWKAAQKNSSRNLHSIGYRIDTQKFEQICGWLSEQFDCSHLHVWASLNRILLTQYPALARQTMVAGNLRDGSLDYFTIADGATKIVSLTSCQPPTTVGLLIQFIEDDRIENYQNGSADWQVNLHLGNSGSRITLQVDASNYSTVEMIDYATGLIKLLTDPLVALL